MDLRYKNLLLWQNILSNKQTVADIEEKLANQGFCTRGGIFSFPYQPCHGAINSRPRNLRTALKKYFRFH